ncbi:B12-binding domain-containing radical SAM protein [Chloroflexota bacterium]
MKVLLLNPPYIPQFIRTSRWAAASVSGSNWYPIYLAYCTGLLEKYGHETKLVDGPVDELSHEDVFAIAQDFSPNITVILVSTASLDNDIAICERLKDLTNSYIILVGPWCSIYPDQIMGNSAKIDAVAIGEFDYTVLELAKGKAEKAIDGLIWRDNDNIIHNPPRNPLTQDQLNELPFVTDVYRRHLNISKYFQMPHLHPFVDLFTGRGCPWGKCTFCLWPHTINKGTSYRKRDMDNVIEELNFIKRELPFVKEVFIQDDTLCNERAKELSTSIIKSGLDITWSCYCRVDTELETLQIMKKSGCRLIHVGYESSNQQILNNVMKGTTVKQMEEFTHNASKVGLLNHADFIIGLPGETVETIQATVKWAKSLKMDSYQFTVPKVYPETPLHNWLEENDYLKDGWPNYPLLSIEDMKKWTKWAIRQTNMNPRYLFRMIKKPKEWQRLIRSARHVLPKVTR